ncbi:MAG: GNAT family N-acetyltransferase [Rhizomicrobium sp.]
MTVKIRVATTADLPALASLHSVCFDEQWTALALGQLLASAGTYALLADDAGGVRGFILVRVAADEAEILTFAVHPLWRRQGLGRDLLCAAARLATLQGGQTLILEVAAVNFAARQLYDRFGFRQAGLRRSYYEPGEKGDAFILKRPLPLAPTDETG